MILVVGVVVKGQNIHGIKILEVETGRTKIASLKGIKENVHIIDNIYIKDSNLYCTDSLIKEYPVCDMNGVVDNSRDSLIVAYIDNNGNFVITSGSGVLQTLTEQEFIVELEHKKSVNATIDVTGTKVVPRYATDFRHEPIKEDESLIGEHTVTIESAVKTTKEDDIDNDTKTFKPKKYTLHKPFEMTADERVRLKDLAEKSLRGLNEQQYKAATTLNGNIRLVAGAGTGKTNTLTKRIAYIVGNGVNPGRILSVTFTNKAAAEMRERAASLLGISEKYLRLQTFHSLCNEILRQSIHVLGWKGTYTLGSDSAFKEMLADIMANDIDIKKIKAQGKEVYIKKKILAATKKVKEHNILAYTDYLLGKPLPKIDRLVDLIAYEEKKDEEIEKGTWDYNKDNSSPLLNYVAHIFAYQKRINYLSYDDLIALTIKMFMLRPDVLEYWQSQFDYIQVDEFQDTNPLQFMLIEMLSKKCGNLFVVGDPDQSIYSFRSADPSILIDLDKKLDNLQTLVMDINYRSTNEILTVGNDVIRMCKERLPKDLRVGTNSQYGVNPKFLLEDSSVGLAKKIARNIKHYVDNGTKLNEIAVLYRSRFSRSLQTIAEQLTLANIPYKVYGNSELNKLPEYEFIVNLLQAICNPANSIHMRKALRCVRGFRMIKRVKEAFGSSDDCVKTFKELYLARKFSVESYLSLDKIYEFIESIEGYKDKLDGFNFYTLNDLITTVFTGESGERIESIQDRIKEAEDGIKDSGGVFDLQSLVADLALVEPDDTDSSNVVQIMTIHKAKGLEFDVVFVIDVNIDNFPSKSALPHNADEEVRLAYVAYTRAKKVLYISSLRVYFHRTQSPSILVMGLNPDTLSMSKMAMTDWNRYKCDAIKAFRRTYA